MGKIGDGLSAAHPVVSGVMQGSALGPVLYSTKEDSVLRSINQPTVAFASDTKYVANLAESIRLDVQMKINSIYRGL